LSRGDSPPAQFYRTANFQAIVAASITATGGGAAMSRLMNKENPLAGYLNAGCDFDAVGRFRNCFADV